MTAENLQRLALVLSRLHVSLRNAQADLPFLIDAKSLALGCNFTFDTDPWSDRPIGLQEPIGDIEVLSDTVDTIMVGSVETKVASLDDLIRIKEHIARPKDRESLLHLRAIKSLRDHRAS